MKYKAGGMEVDGNEKVISNREDIWLILMLSDERTGRKPAHV